MDGITLRDLAGRLGATLKAGWAFLRTMTGDDEYERYLERHARTHPDLPPVDRKSYFKVEITRKWSGIRRCC
ncbi:YbdD/YjiX family protein [Blastochloris viridis]|uniref:Putative small protein n=1 Tax=Blastochloris viridis TaxID=1079 RepID=A0A0H5BP05_BLAVI|nr:YbdD/YjiX family protein [Blastochloris viridis]ALK08186.1 hypothetical protein BVIR_388 [Blastochloris viridis]BAR98548.1 hypothetical protein BV133_955 [Blastochloris viridis]CUU44108.1 putative small protein [Blastochloris viridis]